MMMKDTCNKQSAPLHQDQSQYLGHCQGSEPFISIPLLLQRLCQAVPESSLVKRKKKVAHHRHILVVAESLKVGGVAGSRHCKNAAVYLLKNCKIVLVSLFQHILF